MLIYATSHQHLRPNLRMFIIDTKQYSNMSIRKLISLLAKALLMNLQWSSQMRKISDKDSFIHLIYGS